MPKLLSLSALPSAINCYFCSRSPYNLSFYSLSELIYIWAAFIRSTAEVTKFWSYSCLLCRSRICASLALISSRRLFIFPRKTYRSFSSLLLASSSYIPLFSSSMRMPVIYSSNSSFIFTASFIIPSILFFSAKVIVYIRSNLSFTACRFLINSSFLTKQSPLAYTSSWRMRTWYYKAATWSCNSSLLFSAFKCSYLALDAAIFASLACASKESLSALNSPSCFPVTSYF
jgi:hypothetical protein